MHDATWTWPYHNVTTFGSYICPAISFYCRRAYASQWFLLWCCVCWCCCCCCASTVFRLVVHSSNRDNELQTIVYYLFSHHPFFFLSSLFFRCCFLLLLMLWLLLLLYGCCLLSENHLIRFDPIKNAIEHVRNLLPNQSIYTIWNATQICNNNTLDRSIDRFLILSTFIYLFVRKDRVFPEFFSNKDKITFCYE